MGIRVEVVTTLEDALMDFRRLVEDDGVLDVAVDRSRYIKPSQKKRRKLAAKRKNISMARKYHAAIVREILPRSVTK